MQRSYQELRRRLTVERLHDRVVPAAEISWTGAQSSDWSEGRNWEGMVKPGTGDTAVFGGATIKNAPKIDLGLTDTVGGIKMKAGCGYDLDIEGILSTYGSNINTETDHGIVGTGTLHIIQTTSAVWITGNVKVAKFSITEGGVLEVRGTFGQLGPDSSDGSSSWNVGGVFNGNETAGTLQLNGDHYAGFDQLTIRKEGVFLCTTSGWLRDAGLKEGGIGGNTFLIENRNHFEVAEGQELTLAGGWYKQTIDNGSSPVSVFAPNSGLSVRNFAGVLDGPPDYSIDILGGAVTAYEIASLGAATDILVQDAEIDFFSPGQFSRNNGPAQTSTLTIAAKDANTNKLADIKNTLVKFIDWNPAGRYTSATQRDGKLSVDGNLKLEEATSLTLRMDVGGLTADKIEGVNPASTITLDGNGLSLTAKLENVPGQMGMFPMTFLSAPTVAHTNGADTNPFGGGIALTGDTTGITRPTDFITKSGTGITMKVMKGM
jgi:hypothetical protein